MRRSLFIIFITLLSIGVRGQAPSMSEKLYYSCKVWGFAKYFHSEVSNCRVNWDSVLRHTLPLIESAATYPDFNDALDTMLLAAGPMALSSTYFPDTIKPELKRNRDWGWISAPVFRGDVKTILDTIKNNFRPHPICWVERNTYTTTNTSTLIFPYDSLTLDINTVSYFPSPDERLFVLFSYWNIIRYFNPYNYVCDTSWDSVLYRQVVPMKTVSNAESLYYLFTKITTCLQDGHACVGSYSYNYPKPPGIYTPNIQLVYTENKYVVSRSIEHGITPGDAIINIDGLTPSQFEDSLRPYYSSGNSSFFRKMVCENMLRKLNSGDMETILVADSLDVGHTFNLSCGYDPAFFSSDFFYPNDSLGTIKWTNMPCDIGYVNMGNLQSTDVSGMYSSLKNKAAIIFDLRNYPNATVWDIAGLIYPNQLNATTVTMPDLSYPGTYTVDRLAFGTNANPNAYKGKVIVLVNENTLSQAEYSSMMLRAMPGATIIGSQTAGADGDVTYWKLYQDIGTMFSSFGIYYPNGDSTQRIGIVPDIVIKPTRAGIRHHRDEVLEKALTIGGCGLYAAAENITIDQAVVTIIPNPADEVISIVSTEALQGNISVDITDLSGKVLLHHMLNNPSNRLTLTVDIKALAPGMYLARINTDERLYLRKLVKR